MPPSNVDHTFLRAQLRRNGGVGPIQQTAAKAVGRRIAPGWTRRAHRPKPMLDCDFEALLLRTAYLMTIVKTRYSRLSEPIGGMFEPCTSDLIIPKHTVGPPIDAQNVTHFLRKRKNCRSCLLFRQISPVRLTLGPPPQRRFSPVTMDVFTRPVAYP